MKLRSRTRRRLKWAGIAAGLGAMIALVAVVASSAFADRTPPPVPEKVASYYATPPPPRAVKVISSLGDSYTGGSSMGGYKFKNWTQVAAGMLTTEEVEVASSNTGFGGSGYVKRGPTEKVIGEGVTEAFNDKTDVAVLFGSINDQFQDLALVGPAADKAMTATKKSFPKAKLVIIGPAWMRADVPAEIYEIRDVMSGLAKKHGATFIDPLAERWFFDNPELIGEDKTHPTDAGHAYMAEKIAPRLKPLLAG